MKQKMNYTFLLDAHFFGKERDLLYKVCSEYIHDIEDIEDEVAFVKIMTSTNSNVLLAVAKYIFICLKHRMHTNV